MYQRHIIVFMYMINMYANEYEYRVREDVNRCTTVPAVPVLFLFYIFYR